jgi:hypothetical protein
VRRLQNILVRGVNVKDISLQHQEKCYVLIIKASHSWDHKTRKYKGLYKNDNIEYTKQD